MSPQTGTERGLIESARELARGIAGATIYAEYESARDALQGDDEARALFDELQEAEQRLQMSGSWGGSTQDDIQKVQAIRERVFANATLRRYFDSQEKLVEGLKELNAFMAERLGFDFADMTKPAGGCC